MKKLNMNRESDVKENLTICPYCNIKNVDIRFCKKFYGIVICDDCYSENGKELKNIESNLIELGYKDYDMSSKIKLIYNYINKFIKNEQKEII